MTTTEKLDLVKEHKSEYVKPKKPALVETGPSLYITIRGRGAPGDDDFQTKIAALYGVAYTLKFSSKLAGTDYKVCTLEGLWWGKRRGSDVTGLPKDQWNWQLMIRVPTFTRKKDLAAAIRTLIEKGKDAEVKNVKLETLDEGRCVQMLHIGPYDAVAEPIAAMHAHAADQGLKYHGDHHEIYLSDPRRVAPDRLKTILRRPVKPARGCHGQAKRRGEFWRAEPRHTNQNRGGQGSVLFRDASTSHPSRPVAPRGTMLMRKRWVKRPTLQLGSQQG